MKPFNQTSSILKKLRLIGFLLLVLFLVDLVGTYWTSRTVSKGLRGFQETNELFAASARALDGIEAAVGTLQSAVGSRDWSNSNQVFRWNLEEATNLLQRGRGGLRFRAERAPVIREVEEGLRRLRDTADQIASDLTLLDPGRRDVEVRADLLVLSQFQQEAHDAIRKFQMLLKEEADQMLDQATRTSDYPVWLSSLLGAMILLFAGLVGVPLARNVSRSTENLLAATDQVGEGNLGYQAPILSQDEFGRLTYSFNRMIESLEQKERDSAAHVERERDRLVFLTRCSEKLSHSLEYEATVDEVASVGVPFLADVAALDLLEEDGKVRRAAMAHAFPEKTGEMKVLEQAAPRGLDDAGVVPEVLRTGEPWVLWDSSASSAPSARILRSLGFRGAMSLPLEVRGQTIGALSFCVKDRKFEEQDFLLGIEVAKRASLALENAKLFREANVAIRLRDEFLSIASHELRTPLTPLKMQLQSVRRLLTRGQELQRKNLVRMTDISDKMINRLSSLIDDLLDVARINSGRLPIRFEDFDFVEMVHEVVERFRAPLEAAGCEIVFAASPAVQGRWDRQRCEQIVTNLLTNAMRYGAGHPVEIAVETGAEKVVLCCTDHGIGIAPEDQTRIFRQYERASSARNYGGLGLGLYITSRIVQLHGGEITVQSQPGQGATFRVELPLRPTAEIEAAALELKPPLGVAPASGMTREA